MGALLQRAWARRGPLALLLWPASVLFGALAGARRLLYRLNVLRSTRLPVPVVVVGNVVIGGAGKTPAVIAVLEHLQSRGLRPGLVSRGYGRDTVDCREVLAGSTAAEVGDEPLLIQRRTGVPVVVDVDRVQAALKLLDLHPDLHVVVSDDGLQHYALRRDIEICVAPESGYGNGFLLPAGPLREPASRAADLVLGPGGYRVRRSLAPWAQTHNGTRVALADLRGRKLKAVAGIARPEAFFRMLREHGLEITAYEALPDHYDYAQIRPAGEGEWTIVCTEKDAVKLWRQRPDAFAVPLVVEIDGEFFDALDALLDAQLISRHGP